MRMLALLVACILPTLVGCQDASPMYYGYTWRTPYSATVDIWTGVPAEERDQDVMHELGHVMMGGQHSSDPNDLMYWYADHNLVITDNDIARWHRSAAPASYAVYVQPGSPDWLVESTLSATARWVAVVPVAFTVVVGECPQQGWPVCIYPTDDPSMASISAEAGGHYDSTRIQRSGAF